MSRYLLRRLAYMLPVLLGVNLLTFVLFFMVNPPDDMARLHLGVHRVTQDAIDQWKKERGYDRPLFYNQTESGLERVTHTLFFEKSLRMFVLDFGRSEDGRDIVTEIRERAFPSLAVALPAFVLSLMASTVLALWLVFMRATPFDFAGVLACVALMSISSLFYVLFGQWLVAKIWQWVPVSGFLPGIDALRFLALPVAISVLASLGGQTRWYRALFLDEVQKEYVRAARARGLSEARVLWRHVLPNALIPILTGTVVVLPMLFMGSLIMESFFAIPGLGSYTIEALQAQDFAVVRAMVFLGTLLYLLGLLMTDVAYTLADPRVKLS
jgi:peptide/nickel transport system permease protein